MNHVRNKLSGIDVYNLYLCQPLFLYKADKLCQIYFPLPEYRKAVFLFVWFFGYTSKMVSPKVLTAMLILRQCLLL